MILIDVKEDFPQFAQILALYIIENRNPVAYCQVFSTLSFERHYHSYRVQRQMLNTLVYLKDIVNQHPQIYMLRQLPGSAALIISPKYHIHGTAF